jgi:hypothetical protein
MKISRVHVPEGVEGSHDLTFDYGPGRMQEPDREAIRSWRLVWRQGTNNRPYFLLGETIAELLQVETRKAKLLKVDGVGASCWCTQNLIKELKGNLSLTIFSNQGLPFMDEGVNVIIASAGISVAVEEFSRRIPSLSHKIRDSCRAIVHCREARPRDLSFKCWRSSSSWVASCLRSRAISSLCTTSFATSSCTRTLLMNLSLQLLRALDVFLKSQSRRRHGLTSLKGHCHARWTTSVWPGTESRSSKNETFSCR